jgi:glutamyl-tRNA synthetase
MVSNLYLANVVDDHLMQISHDIRGEEWLNESPPPACFIVSLFGWELPQLRIILYC